MNCKECNIPDVNCDEQCKEEMKYDCVGCFGASFNDCGDCPKWKVGEGDGESTEICK